MIMPVLRVLRISRMVAQHIQSRLGEIVFHHVVDIFVMSPGQVDITQAASRGIYAVFCLVYGIVIVRIILKIFGINNFVRVGTPHGEGIPYYRPLRLVEQAKRFSHTSREERGLAYGAD